MLHSLLALLLILWGIPAGAQWRFTDVTTQAGVAYEHGYLPESEYSERAEVVGGVASGDYDRDGWVDLYVVRGEIGPNLLFRNRGDGTFEEKGAEAGVGLTRSRGSGPLFADFDGDGWTDLFVGGVDGTPLSVFRNAGDGTFTDVTATSGIEIILLRDTVGATAADWDRDGDLDLVLAHWLSTLFDIPDTSSQHLWRNDGGMLFTDITLAAGLVPVASGDNINGFTAGFADIDADGWPDLLLAADFRTSRVYRNLGGTAFEDRTDRSVITDGNGMGSAIGDYDGDGDFDWFVSSIWDPNGVAEGNWDTSGNRLYRNRGDGTFEDATEAAGVRRGYWGWASTFQDFNNDGHLDLFHLNGFGDVSIPETAEFLADPARLFVGNGDGTFTERSAEIGIADTGDGRGVVAFDYDRDGDLDVFIANNGESFRLYRNDGLPQNNSITVRLRMRNGNSEAIGARVDAVVNGRLQRRLVEGGSNYVSQNPAEIHFGLGGAPQAERLAILWPDGVTTAVGPVAAGSRLVLTHPDLSAPACDTAAPQNTCSPGGSGPGECRLEWRLAGALTDRRNLPSTLALCQEGDPRCDVDPDTTNGECVLSVALCVDSHDPRVGTCTPGAAAAALDEPSSDASDPVDHSNREQLLSALAVIGLPPLTDVLPVFTNGQPDHCSAAVNVRVPLRPGPKGPRKGTRRITLRVGARDGTVDLDRVRLMCSPSPVRRSKAPRRY